MIEDQKPINCLVSAQKIQQFQQNGYVKLSNVASEVQLTAFRQVMNLTINKILANKDNQNRIDDYSSIFDQVTNLWKLDQSSHSFILNPKFGRIAAQLLGVDKVRLYHDQALVKQPKAGKTPWHQDYFYWPIASQKTVTMWIPMHACKKQMGTMRFVKGSHKNSNLKKMPISEGSEKYFETQIENNGLQVQSYDLDIGQATFHYGRTLHCAYSNSGNYKRQAMTIIYFEDGAKSVVEQEMNQFRKVDLSVFCPGVKLGEKIESELNPLIQ